jgi:chemotaxis protein MotB
MARRQKHGGHENHERWLVSYADFITLLFAFFVVMFASSQTNKDKAARVSESVKRALEENQVATALAGILGGTVHRKGPGNAQMRGPGGTELTESPPLEGRAQELAASMTALESQLKLEIDAGLLEVNLEPRGLVVSLRQAAFFPSAEDAIEPGTFPVLEKIAGAVRQLPNKIRLEGHTDSDPIHNQRFRSNWELSAARAVALLVLFTERYGLAAGRFSIAGYAENAPMVSNQTEEGKARNRRVDVVVLNDFGLRSEPQPGKGSASQGSPPQAGH